MDLDYDPRLSKTVVQRLEDAARRTGLALDRLELLGQDTAIAEVFADRVDAGRGQTFLADVDWSALEALRRRRRADVAAWVDRLAPERTGRTIEP